MPLSPSLSIHLEEDILNDCKSVLRKLDNMKNEAARPNFFMDSKLMMLKLRRARLGAQLAYSRHQSLLAEIELRLAETDLKYELSRRRQFVTRSRAIRQTMKSLTDGTSKKNKVTGIDEDAVIHEKNTVDKSTQIGEVTDKTDHVEQRKDSVSRKKKRHTDKDSLTKEKTMTSSRVGTDETHSIDKATTSSKEVKNSKPSKKHKTDEESHCSDKGEKTNRRNRDSREKRKERRDSKKSSKDKSCDTNNNKKTTTSSNKQELHNDKHKDKDSETNEKHARKKHEAQVKKPTTSVSKNPTTKDIKSVSTVSNNQTINGNKNQEPLLWEMENSPLTIEETNYICEASEENSDKQIESTTADEAVQPSNYCKCDIFTNSCNPDKSDAVSRPDFTVVLEVRDRNVVHQIKEMCESPAKEVLGNDFKEFRVMKRERSSSISSVETLKL